MNFKLAFEAYKMNPWCIDAHSLPGLLAILANANTLELPEIKYNTPMLFLENGDTRIVKNRLDLDNEEIFSAIGVIKINGPITVNGGASSLGMKELSKMMLQMNEDSRVKSFIVLADSGGGSSSAVKIMSDTINEVKQEKEVIGLIEKGGMAASAMYGILTACTKIYSEDQMAVVGSAGTMIQFAGRKANVEGDDKVKYVRLYASKSEKKNEGFEEALNNENYEVIIDNLLNPVNEQFLNLIETNRPILKGTDYDDGHAEFAQDSIGKFVDGIKSLEEVVQELEQGFVPDIYNSNNNLNNSEMNRDELKSKHPKLFQEVYNEGVAAEKDRAGAWMAHIKTDSKAVVTGIESGKPISQTDTQKFIVKQMSNAQLQNLEDDSAGATQTNEAKNPKKKDEPSSEVDAFYASIDRKLNINLN